MTSLHSKAKLRSAAVVAAVVVAAAVTPVAQAATYTVTYGTTGSYAHPTDTPASTFIDKDGTFYFQQSASLYGATQPRYWAFFTGANFDTATRSSAISDAVNPNNANDKNNDTTWRCNNSPTGLESTYAPAGSSYSQPNFCTLIGVWVDPDTGHWYGLVHNEFTPQPFGDGLHYDSIDYAVSTDQGRTWTIKDHAITSPYSTKRGDTTAFPHQTYHYGTGDQRLFVDTASGYFYVFYGSRIVDKSGGWKAFYGHVARSPIASKMAKGSWQKWYGGAWTQPGIGGRESTMVPTSTNPNGYVPTTAEYNPLNTGTASQQIADGKMPPISPLFVMNIAYNAHLGLYIGTPQAVDQSGNAPQEVYATADLTTQKWTLLGNSGSYRNASWYRWFLDSASKTGSTIIGKDYRSYCSIACTNSSGEYANTTITSSAGEPALFDPARTYTIGTGTSRVLSQVSGSSATTSAAPTGSALEAWRFTANGDGSYRIANASTGQLLGVGTSSASTRAWGTKPTATAGGPTVGQQWWVVRTTGQSTYRLVNRYSGLVLALSSDTARPAETTPARFWTNTTGNAVGGARTAAEQTLTITPVGAADPSLNGTRTVTTSGKALDNPGSSTTAGTQLITWTPNAGANQRWQFTQQADGSYTIVNQASNLCVDDYAGATTPGTKVIQWTCTGGANQRWQATKLANGLYTLTNVHSGLLLTTASTTNGALVTQETNSGSALQQWSIG
ncbi:MULTISPECIES: RICIN domain-containing protein [unclassified Saccharothrix]|uniref:RICIN domain-containing protein n=1 Tax=unclassified Saccharothrix TaxID=2593673 RepID=UPI00307FAE9D